MLEVVFAMDQLEFAPLANVERAENGVAGASTGRAEEGLGFGEEHVEMSELLGRAPSQIFAGERMRRLREKSGRSLRG